MINIYEKAFQIMDPKDIDHHYSDLYLRVTDKSRELVGDQYIRTINKTEQRQKKLYIEEVA